VLPSTTLRRLALLPFALLACTGNETLSPVDGGATTSSSSSGGTTSSSSATTGGSGGTGGHGGATTSSTGGAGGSTSASSSGSGGASSSSSASSSGSGGTGGSTSASSSGSGGASSSSTSSSSSASSGTGGGSTGTRVRVVAANLTSGTQQSYDPGHGIRILRGVHGDILLMQEMNYGTNSATDLRSLVDQVCGTDCVFARGVGSIPNGVVSRYPILESGTWADPKVSNRDFTWAHIDVPGPVDLWAVSVHLLTTSTTDRNAEGAALIADLQGKVPAGDHLVLGGDFNTDNRAEPVVTTLSALFSTAAPYPADGGGNSNTSAPRTRPYDWVLTSAGLRTLETPVVIGAAHFDAGLVVDTRVYTPIADLSPALMTDSGASGMQHMAVVRDFLLP
jgi:endonuclease/exonuclease/phosphatase family metal-dependent hydrolase